MERKEFVITRNLFHSVFNSVANQDINTKIVRFQINSFRSKRSRSALIARFRLARSNRRAKFRKNTYGLSVENNLLTALCR